MIRFLLFLFSVNLAGAQLLASGPDQAQTCEPLERNVYLMGTEFDVSLGEPDRNKALQQLESIVRIVEDAEAQLSTWRESSELSKFNHLPVGFEFEMSDTLCDLLHKLNSYVAATNGAFDPTVGRLLQVWEIQSGFRAADSKAVSGAVAETGFSHLDLRGCSLRKNTPVLFDAGAFGKGEALDRILSFAANRRLGPLVLNFGGQIAVWDLSHPIEIQLADPSRRTLASPVRIRMAGGSVATSGGSERDGQINGKTIGHILDPHSGYPAPSFGSVTVWHPHALDADILSTALYVMGPEKGLRWAEQNQIAACFLLKNSKKAIMTTEFRKLLAKNEK